MGEPIKGYRVATQPTAADKFRFDSSRPEVYGVGEPMAPGAVSRTSVITMQASAEPPIQMTDTFGAVPLGQTYGIGEPVKGYRGPHYNSVADEFKFGPRAPAPYGVGEEVKSYTGPNFPTEAGQVPLLERDAEGLRRGRGCQGLCRTELPDRGR